MRNRPAVWVLISCLAVAGSARAQEEETDAELSRIRELVLYASYREAREAAEVLLQRESLSASERNAGLEVLAVVNLAMRDEDGAGEALTKLYRRDPGHRLSDPDASPTVVSAFARARERVSDPVPVVIDHQVPELSSRAPLVLSLTLTEGADAVDAVRLGYRQGEEIRYTTVSMTADPTGTARARIPTLAEREAYEVDYYVEAVAPSGYVLARQGTAQEPLTMLVPEAREDDVLVGGGGGGSSGGGGAESGGGVATKWWFWTIIGVAVAGGVTGGVLAARAGGGPDDGSLGNVRFP